MGGEEEEDKRKNDACRITAWERRRPAGIFSSFFSSEKEKEKER